MYVRMGMGCAGNCAGCPQRRACIAGLGEEDPLAVLKTIPLVTPGTHTYALDPAYYLTPAARIQPWVAWPDQEFIKGVSNKTLLVSAAALALLAAMSGGSSSGKARR